MMPAAQGGTRRQDVPTPFRHVLVGWDGSPGSVAALRTAAAIVAGAPGHVTALAVLPSSPHAEERRDEHKGDASVASHIHAAYEAARAGIERSSDVRMSLHTTVSRHPAKVICDYAAERGFDLLVLGRHGEGGVLHPRLGHVADAAAKSTAIPVLLVSAPRD